MLDHNNDDHKGRVIRTFQLANFCIANIAAYRVNWDSNDGKKSPRINLDFWMRSNGALFDMAVIDWCKLFADRTSKHHWSMLFTNKDEWRAMLTAHMQMTEESYENNLLQIKSYRDKVAAHLDDPLPMNYPLTEFMLVSSSFLYDQIKQSKSTKIHIGPIYDSATEMYNRLVAEYEQEILVRLKSL